MEAQVISRRRSRPAMVPSVNDPSAGSLTDAETDTPCPTVAPATLPRHARWPADLIHNRDKMNINNPSQVAPRR
ncbi:hypothetical protein NX02_03620 [Sphingomonas sanxanigenens DSM 19645 = NX02]|uniref:Uncharacterized protein n=1 Tax=Sphingomonas sanxanigenens DSM 19645 = NX02 TaxID=1123269 RepID=W0A844_9SPHN|nr:hypothetical protein NX02_03620 [Sphingomonas sanxanigenens DSM 19645 = NX02]